MAQQTRLSRFFAAPRSTAAAPAVAPAAATRAVAAATFAAVDLTEDDDTVHLPRESASISTPSRRVLPHLASVEPSHAARLAAAELPTESAWDDDWDLEPTSNLRSPAIAHVATTTARASTAAATTRRVLTPLERQVLALKCRVPSAVLLLQAGYKYRAFGRDAAVLARVARVTAYRPRDRVLATASIPTHRIGVHVRRMVARGLAVAVVVQTEGAAAKAAGVSASGKRSGTFARDIFRVYTPSTLSADALIGDTPAAEDTDRDARVCVVWQQDSAAVTMTVCSPTTRQAVVHTCAPDALPIVWQRLQREECITEVLVPAAAPDVESMALCVSQSVWRVLAASCAPAACSVGYLQVCGHTAERWAPRTGGDADRACILPTWRSAVDVAADAAVVTARIVHATELITDGTEILPRSRWRTAAPAVDDADDDAASSGPDSSAGDGDEPVKRARVGDTDLVNQADEQISDEFDSKVRLEVVPMRFRSGQTLDARTCCILAALRYEAAMSMDAASDVDVDRYSVRQSGAAQPTDDAVVIDDITLADLQILRASSPSAPGAGLALLDVLHGKAGPMSRRVLNKWLAQPLRHREAVQRRQSAVAQLRVDADSPCAACACIKNVHAAVQAAGFPDVDSWVQRLSSRACNPAVVYRLVSFVSTLLPLCTGTAPASCACDYLHEVVRALASADGVRSFQHYTDSSLDEAALAAAQRGKSAAGSVDARLFRMRTPEVRTAHPELVHWSEALQSAQEGLEQELQRIRALLRKPAIDWTSHRSGPTAVTECLVEVKRTEMESPLAPLAIPADWVQINATKQVVRFHTPRTMRLLEELAVARDMLAAAADAAWHTWCNQAASRFGHALRAWLAHIAHIEALGCLARVAATPGWCMPELVNDADGPQLWLEQARHPMMELSLTQRREPTPFIASDVHLARASGLVAVLTGPNAGGKSTLVRLTAVCVLLAQIGSAVPAQAARLTCVDAIATRMGAQDAITAGRSTFQVEMEEVARIVKLCDDAERGRVFAVFDELGRGTATFDGTALALATLRLVVERCPRTMAMFVTHYPELTRLHAVFRLRPSLRVLHCHMAFIEQHHDDGTTSVVLLYHLTPGVAGRSYGLRVAALAGLPAHIIADAERDAGSRAVPERV